MARSNRWIVVSPHEAQGRSVVGSYYERCGWLVRNAETGWVHSSGDERNMRQTARELNRRAS
jgi:hypothetical protein